MAAASKLVGGFYTEVVFGVLATGAAAFAVHRLVQGLYKEDEWVHSSSTPIHTSSVSSSSVEPKGDNASGVAKRKPRVGGMKLSRLSKMLDDMTDASDLPHCGDKPASKTPAVQLAAETDYGAVAHSWDEQMAEEKQVLEATTLLIQDVRRSEVHRKLPHFHVVDRELQTIEEQMKSLSISVTGFWRYGRDEPMATLLKLPLMQLAKSGGQAALIPVSQGFVKETSGANDEAPPLEPEDESSPDADLALLGLENSRRRIDRDAVESAFRHRSRHFHRHGRCSNVRGFDLLCRARNRCLARLAMPRLRAYGGGGDLVAHYLLMGTDPGESRYREYAVGILDGLHRDQVMQKMQILQWPTWDIPLTWGDDADMVGFGGQSPWASG